MSTHHATIRWALGPDEDFTGRRYSRAHRWQFDGGADVAASSSPTVVRLPFSDPSAVDPEEAFIAALSSCHMLWFLDLAARAGYEVTRYDDPAEGLMAPNEAGQDAITEVMLRPEVQFGGAKAPDEAAVQALHHAAHEHCFIANSVRSSVRCEGSWSYRTD